MEKMKELKTETVDAKYIFIDIVDYTLNRSIEAQTYMISIMNKIVKDSLTKYQIDKTKVLFIQTGDGIWISLLNIVNPYDIHLKIALMIIEKLHNHNKSIKDNKRKFTLRVGINENTDNLIIDINGHNNISGAGINNAARLMSLCDENHIMVGTTVYEKLAQREKYMNSFSLYSRKVKHDISLNAYQYRNFNLKFLNSESPKFSKKNIEPISKLPKLVGYYFAHCIKNENFLDKNIGNIHANEVLIILTYSLAIDFIYESRATKTHPNVVIRIKQSLQDKFDEYRKYDIWPIHDLARFITDVHLKAYKECFKEGYLYINNFGYNKLKLDHPQIYEEFEINNWIPQYKSYIFVKI